MSRLLLGLLLYLFRKLVMLKGSVNEYNVPLSPLKQRGNSVGAMLSRAIL